MKKMKIFATLLMLFAFTASVNAQFLTKEQQKAVKKDVKKYEKEGWKVKPGSPSIAMQLTKSYQMAWERTADGTDQWMMGEGSSIGTIYDAARTQAMTVAQGEIARKMKTHRSSQLIRIRGLQQMAAEMPAEGRRDGGKTHPHQDYS